MIEQDTIRLLRECDAGIQMGTSSIEQVVNRVKSPQFKQRLEVCKQEHQKLAQEIQKLLDRYQDEGKSPNPMAKGMSWIKTNPVSYTHLDVYKRQLWRPADPG